MQPQVIFKDSTLILFDVNSTCHGHMQPYFEAGGYQW